MQRPSLNFISIIRLVAIIIFISVLFSSFSTNAFAATGINRQINFQGKLVDNNGLTVADNTYSIIFSFYNGTSGGAALWTETDSVTTVAGIFRVPLGAVTPIPADFNFNWDGLYLGIKISTEINEMAPRIAMTAVPFAFNAQQVAGLTVQDENGNASTSGTLKIPNGATITLPGGGTLLTNTAAAVQTLTSTQSTGTVLGVTDSTALTGAIKGAVITLSGTNAYDQTGLEFNLSNASGANLNDIVGTGGTWKVSKAGALTVASCTGCGAAPGGSGSNWTLDTVNGILRPNNNVVDLLFGGTATSSAKFAVLNLSSGTVTASNSGNFALSGAATAHTFNILDNGTLNFQRYPSGDTANNSSVLFLGNNGRIGIGNTAPGALLDLGLAGTTLGVVRLAGSTSGNVSLQPNAIAGTDIILTLPSTAGTLVIGGGTASGTNTGDSAANSSTMYIGTTAVALNRASAALILAGITSIDGTAAGLGAQYIDWSSSSGGNSIVNKPTLGTISSQAASGVAITGGTAAGLTGLAIRDTSAAFDVTLAAASSVTLDAGRTLTLDMANTANTLKFAGASTITFPTGTNTLLGTTGSIAGLTGTISSTVLGNSTVYIGSTAVLLNRGTGDLALTGITSIDGTAAGLDSATGDVTVAANDGLTFAATTLGNNGSRNVTINAGSTGTTATLIVKLDTSGTVITTDTTTLNNAVGVALDTKTSGQAVRVAIQGVITATADNTVAAGDYIGVGTSTAGRAKSLGTTYPSTAGIQVIGRALGGASAGNTLLLMLNGLDNNVSAGAACSTCVSFATGTADNTTGTNNLIQLSVNSVNRFTVANKGGLTVNGSNGNVVRTTTGDNSGATDFGRSDSSIDATLTNANDRIELSDGTPVTTGGCTACGSVTNLNALSTLSAVGAGAHSISRPDGKYMVILGGNTSTTNVYNSIAGTMSTTGTVTLSAAAGAGALSLPRPDGKYVVVLGNSTSTTSVVDPVGTTASAAGSSVTVGVVGAGSTSFRRANGRFLVVQGGGISNTTIFNPVASTFTAGPNLTGGVAAAGAVALSRPDGQALIVHGGSTSLTSLYNPIGGAGDIGATSAGPTLGASCVINNAGSIAMRRQDGKYVILSAQSVSALYDPVANIVTCRAFGPSVALGDGAHAIPIQNGKFLIVTGGTSTNADTYDQSTDSFTNLASNAVTAGASGAGKHSILRANGKWQIIVGGGAKSDTYDTNMPMSGTYLSDNINSTAINNNSVMRWTAQHESVYTGANANPNTAFASMQFFISTAVSSGGLGTYRELNQPGDLIGATAGDQWAKIKVVFNRQLPKRLTDERGTWAGNGVAAMRMDFATPTLFDVSIDNSVALRRNNFDWTMPNSSVSGPVGTAPAAPTSNAPTSGGSCTAGTHYWKYTFVTNGQESLPSAPSAAQTCGANATGSLTNVVAGPSASNMVTSARKIYRSLAGTSGSDISGFFYAGSINDNTTTVYADAAADASLTALAPGSETSGPTGMTTRVEAQSDRVYLPFGRVSSQSLGTSGFYLGLIGNAHPVLPDQATTEGGIVIKRPDNRFVVISGGGAVGTNTHMYDPAATTFTLQTGSNTTTVVTGPGAHAVKRPDGKFLVVIGNSTSTTNIYDPVNNTFVAGPTLPVATAGIGSSSIPNRDGTFTIVQGGAISNTSLYDPVRNTMVAGPFTSTPANCGAWAIPLAGDNDGMYRVFPGVAGSTVGISTSMVYDSRAKVFTAGAALTAIHGCGSFAFQRQDGYWVTVPAQAAAAAGSSGTNILNPWENTTIAGPTLGGQLAGHGSHVLPRADGTFLIINGNGASLTTVYIPYGGTYGVGTGIGSAIAGPVMPAAVGTAASVTNGGQGTLSFQRPDGKFVTIIGAAGSTVATYDGGWYSDGQYLSEQIQVPALSANSTFEWRQSPDNFVRYEVKAASTQATLGTASTSSIGRSGDSINNTGGETWVQVEMNFRRIFPSFGGAMQDTYRSSGGGQVYDNLYAKIAKPTVYEFKIQNGQDLINLQDNGLSMFRVTSGGNVYSGPNGSFLAGGADLAENYTSTDGLEPGDVVKIDPMNPQGVLRSTGQYQQTLLGVVSTAPGFVAGAQTDNSFPIGLVGRIPVKVSNENGPIKIGDYLTAASIPGYAMKSTQAGRVLGKALEDFDTSETSMQMNACPLEGMGNVSTTKCGKVTMFVNLTDYLGAPVEVVMQDMEQAKADATAVAGAGLESTVVSSGLIGSFLNQLPETDQKILAFLKNLNDEKQKTGVPLSEVFTDRVSAATEMISPKMITDILYAKIIRADRIEGLEILTNKISSLQNQMTGLSVVREATSSGVIAVATESADMRNTVEFESGKFNFDLSVLGGLNANGGLIVSGPSEFKGQSIFNDLVTFVTQVIFKGDVTFFGRPTFNKDTAGFAVIKNGQRVVDVVFDKEYETKPIVTLSLILPKLDDNAFKALVDSGLCAEQEGKEVCQEKQASVLFGGSIKYVVDSQDTKGFAILLGKPAPLDTTFSWHAIAVKDSAISINNVPGDLHLPFAGSIKITNKFGEQGIDPVVREQDQKLGLIGHDGIDFAMSVGTAVLAVDDGDVLPMQNGVEEYGATIVIQHAWGKSFYGHLSEIYAKPGQKVAKGKEIALSGDSGLSTGAHLHFGMKLNQFNQNNGFLGKSDPLRFLNLEQGIAFMNPILQPIITSTPMPQPTIKPLELSIAQFEQATQGITPQAVAPQTATLQATSSAQAQ